MSTKQQLLAQIKANLSNGSIKPINTQSSDCQATFDLNNLSYREIQQSIKYICTTKFGATYAAPKLNSKRDSLQGYYQQYLDAGNLPVDLDEVTIPDSTSKPKSQRPISDKKLYTPKEVGVTEISDTKKAELRQFKQQLAGDYSHILTPKSKQAGRTFVPTNGELVHRVLENSVTVKEVKIDYSANNMQYTGGLPYCDTVIDITPELVNTEEVLKQQAKLAKAVREADTAPVTIPNNTTKLPKTTNGFRVHEPKLFTTVDTMADRINNSDKLKEQGVDRTPLVEKLGVKGFAVNRKVKSTKKVVKPVNRKPISQSQQSFKQQLKSIKRQLRGVNVITSYNGDVVVQSERKLSSGRPYPLV